MCQRVKQMTNTHNDSLFFLSFLEAQQYHVYTLQPLSNPLQRNSLTASSVLSQQQQEYIHQQQELKGINFGKICECKIKTISFYVLAANDLPPKYEDVVGDSSYTIPIGYAMPSSSANRPYDAQPTDVNTSQIVRY